MKKWCVNFLLCAGCLATCAGAESITVPETKVSICPTAHNARCKPVTVDGRAAWQSLPQEQSTGSRYFYFDVQDPLLKNGNAESATITLTYKDQFNAPLFLQYDSKDQAAEQGGIWKRLDGVTTGNSGEWETVSWTLDDALFRSRAHAHDFRVVVGADVDFVISDKDMEFLENMEQIQDYGSASMFPVYGGKLG